MQTNLLDYLEKQYVNKDCDPKSNKENQIIFKDTMWCFSNKGPFKRLRPKQSEVIWKIDIDPKPVFPETLVSVHNLKTLEMAGVFVRAGYNPLVLNMASDWKPGGGVWKGSRAQEEDLFRKTNYFMTLDKRRLPENAYPLKGVNMIYSPNVSVIKDSNYNYVDQPYQVDFVACPAIRNPTIERRNGIEEHYAHEADEYLMEQRIELIYKLAYAKGHDSMILGALGCGAFHNPVEAVAGIFKKMNKKYKGCFKCIGFPVFSTAENPNYYIFKRILEMDD